MIKIGINGFGRIGRSITRIISSKKDLKIVAINEINNDLDNLGYLLKYDTIYGKLKNKINVTKSEIKIDNKRTKFFCKKDITEVPWNKLGIDVVIDATGVAKNVKDAKKIIKNNVKKIVITHSPDKNIDFTMIMGVNEKSYNYRKHDLVSSSICDASAIGPVLKELDENFKIETGFVTTLHPRLSYQNLLDGSLKSVSSPGHNWKNFSLGRDSISNLIPKQTTAIKAVTKCISGLNNKISGLSFRIPTSIVCASDLTIKVKNDASVDNVNKIFKKLSITKSKIFEFETNSLVSSDYLGTNKSVIIDSKFTNVMNKQLIKMVIWYDNEWGYSNRVVDIVKYILKK